MKVPGPDPVPGIPEELAFDAAIARDLLVDFLRRETRKAGLSRAVVGLSGGVDSATAAALARRALGRRRVVCVLLPYGTSNPESLRDGRRVARLLGVRTACVPITPMVDAYFARARRATRLRRGNKMARERMAILYDLSAREKALVIGTSNKTEILLGYGTLFGDLACALNPLGDLYKTQVRALARHLGLPEDIVSGTPSAGLWAGQTDEDEIGYRYEDLDRLLWHLVDGRMTPAEAIAAGFPRRMVRSVVRRLAASRFKRRPPLIAKLSARTPGIDFLYPRDAGV